jgi:hypothetical protein
MSARRGDVRKPRGCPAAACWAARWLLSVAVGQGCRFVVGRLHHRRRLQPLGTQAPPVSPGGNDYRAFRAVRIGRAVLTHAYACGEACQRPMQVFITVTDGCQLLSRTEAVNLTLPPYPIPPPQMTSAKLIRASQYDQIFGTRLDLPAETLVWAVLTAAPPFTVPTPPTPGPLQWGATAVDACTDWTTGGWSGDGAPAGWSAVADQSSGV